MHDLAAPRILKALSWNDVNTLSDQRPLPTKRHHISPFSLLLLYYSTLFSAISRPNVRAPSCFFETDRSSEHYTLVRNNRITTGDRRKEWKRSNPTSCNIMHYQMNSRTGSSSHFHQLFPSERSINATRYDVLARYPPQWRTYTWTTRFRELNRSITFPFSYFLSFRYSP